MDDMIHMTEGEKLLHYWPLWLGIIVVVVLGSILSKRKER
ncbi:LPXTG cell wall anchor domain-containing protein [Paenibacillus tianjinensis]|uniref:LPXTG cell wall anchor domain-containing protein n=1 Tax=Paenibacillus tianjinensis TaxID=2810347 RepID=A0ABX7L4E8_9BACL|nr:LPXTG cell wall anchor domain-containing protein [Paenibacillus tianjinensis]QSF42668.1 LPXTG cell wall anchor domain-containing protein [Paenibacillus tianjinensis]